METTPVETVLTVEAPALDREDVWGFLGVRGFEFNLTATSGPFQGEGITGPFLPVGRGAAEVTDGGPTEIFRATFEVEPGEYDYTLRLRDPDGEVVFTDSMGPIRVAADATTEVYRLFDPKTADPSPIYRPVRLQVDVPAVDATAIDALRYDIECGTFRDDDLLPKRSYDCTTTADGNLERAMDDIGPFPVRFEATHLVGCGPCALELEATDAAGEPTCAASVRFEVDGWGFRELPAETVRVALSCGVSP